MMENNLKSENKEELCVEFFPNGTNFEYILDKEEIFSDTDYKIMQAQQESSLLPCMKIRRNGKISLFYDTGDLDMLELFLGEKNPGRLISVLKSYLMSLIEVRENGFLSYSNIVISPDRIFVDKQSNKVKLVYLPVFCTNKYSNLDFENNIRSDIIKILNTLDIECDSTLLKFREDLMNGRLTLSDLAGTFAICGKDKKRSPGLIGIDVPDKLEISLRKDCTVIGKKAGMVDFAISFNNMISRRHCKVYCENGDYYLQDEGSTNGTFLNGRRLSRGVAFKLSDGDIIKLANVKLRFET